MKNTMSEKGFGDNLNVMFECTQILKSDHT